MHLKRQIKRASLAVLESRLFWLSLVLAVFLGNAAWCWRNRVNGDVAWYLYAVTRLRDGAVLYRDIHDINLPFVYLIHMPLAYASAILPVPIQILMYGALWILVAGAIFAFYRTPGISAIGRRLMLLVIAFAALSLDRRDFGQRDLLCALLFIGLVLSIHRRIQRPVLPTGASWMLIAAAAVGIAIKPYFLVPWFFVLLVLARHVGLRRAVRAPEAWLILLVSAATWAGTLIVFPDYLRMASVASRFYGSLNGSPWLFLPLAIPLLVVTVAISRSAGRIQPLIHLSAAATLGFAIECLAQRKAFPYHLASSIFWCVITTGLLLVDMIQKSSGRRAFWRVSAAMVPVAVSLAVFSLWSAIVPPPEFVRTEVDRFVLAHAHGKMILSLSTDLWTAFPLILEASATNARPDAALWPLGGLYRNQAAHAKDSPTPVLARYHTRQEMTTDERESFDQVISVLTTSRPAVILVQTGYWKQGMGGLQFDFLDYFSMDPRFQQALRSYKPGPSDSKRFVLFRAD